MKKDSIIERTKRYEEYLKSELEAIAMYEILADTETDPERSQIFLGLVDSEKHHAYKWAQKLELDEEEIKPANLGFKGKLLHWTSKKFGTNLVLPILLQLESKEMDVYLDEPEASDIVGDERRHSRILRKMSHSSSHPFSRRFLSGGRLRASVLGVNDGLVSNFGLVTGVAGGTASSLGGSGDQNIVLLAGFAGLLAGAFSMASGEYVSVRSQRDLFEHEMRKEAIELKEWPDEEKEDLTSIYEGKGLSPREARNLANRVVSDPKLALETMCKEKLGLNPSDLGSPWGASVSSFTAFVMGALVPLAPYLLYGGDLSLALSATLSIIALAAIGGTLAGMSGRNIIWGGLRLLFAGSAAATITFAVGSLIGVSVSAL